MKKIKSKPVPMVDEDKELAEEAAEFEAVFGKPEEKKHK